ncbi:MAG: cytochrome c [Bdellovibrionales bacterium]|nr:cytochrome c [Bdellovibrionales bacterium]
MCPRITLYSILFILFFGYTGIIYTSATHFENSALTKDSSEYRGRLVFQQHNCVACHQIYGLGGHLGPDLTNVVSNPRKGEAYARAIIRGGASPMPKFNLTDTELDDLIAFLKQADSSGESPPINFKITPWGSIEVQHGNPGKT